MTRASAGLLLLLLAGCAQQPIKALWIPPGEEWTRAEQAGIHLKRHDGTSAFVPAARLRTLLGVKADLERASGVRAELGLADTDAPNAFAFERNGRPVIAVSLSWLEHFGEDRDALATTVGHELAHLRLGHRGEDRQNRELAASAGGQIVGTLLNLAGVPLGGYIGSYGVAAFARSFTRDEERAADELGLRWAAEAGYDPCGHWRVARVLKSATTLPQITFLSTHPGYDERSEAASAMALRTGRRSCQ